MSLITLLDANFNVHQPSEQEGHNIWRDTINAVKLPLE